MSRFAEPQDEAFRALNASIAFDIRLAPYDIEQSRAHARMLARCEVIAAEEAAELERGLELVRDEIESGRFEAHPGDEDVHMAIERRLTELVGPVGGKLHTARSRNDQVATDMAMFVRGRARVAGDLLTAKLDPARTRLQEAEDRLDQGRLAGPVGADDGHDLALADVDRDPADDVDLGHVPGDQLLGLKQHSPLRALGRGAHDRASGATTEPPR